MSPESGKRAGKEPPPPRSITKVVLFGMRASGKSTLGRALAAALRWGFLDTDEAIGARVGSTAGAFLSRYGEAAFRTVEREVVLAALAHQGTMVIALGGGAVTSEDVRVGLRAPGVLPVLLQAPPEVLVERQAKEPRPPLTDLSLAQEVASLMQRRGAAHDEVAAITLETFPANVDACCASLLATIAPLLSDP